MNHRPIMELDDVGQRHLAARANIQMAHAATNTTEMPAAGADRNNQPPGSVATLAGPLAPKKKRGRPPACLSKVGAGRRVAASGGPAAGWQQRGCGREEEQPLGGAAKQLDVYDFQPADQMAPNYAGAPAGPLLSDRNSRQQNNANFARSQHRTNHHRSILHTTTFEADQHQNQQPYEYENDFNLNNFSRNKSLKQQNSLSHQTSHHHQKHDHMIAHKQQAPGGPQPPPRQMQPQACPPMAPPQQQQYYAPGEYQEPTYQQQASEPQRFNETRQYTTQAQYHEQVPQQQQQLPYHRQQGYIEQPSYPQQPSEQPAMHARGPVSAGAPIRQQRTGAPPPPYQSQPVRVAAGGQRLASSPYRAPGYQPAPAAAYQPVYQPSPGAFNPQQEPEQYPSNSPTLLQQQLNRQPAPPPQMRPAMGPQRANYAATSQKRRYEPDHVEAYANPHRQALPEPGYYPPGARPAPLGPAPRLAAPGAQQAQKHRIHHQHQDQQLLLGNPTPPLTPTSTQLPANRSQQQQQHEQQWHSQPQMAAANEHQHVHQPMLGYNQPPKHHLIQNEAQLGARLIPKCSNNQNYLQSEQVAPTSGGRPLANAPTQQQTLSQQQDCSLITRLTLPIRDSTLLGPFKLDHDAQFTSKVFHIKAQLFETLSKSLSLMNPQTATVVHELQFKAFLVNKQSQHQTESLLVANTAQQSAANNQRVCNWPELFQVSINQNVLHLDRTKGAHKAVDIFQFCQPGDNVIDIQVNDCYCTHEFVLEAVERPTLKAFMNSCFKSRVLSQELCVQKLKNNFGTSGFIFQSSPTTSAIFNEYLSEQMPNGYEQTRVRISLKCPITLRRMRTPTRGANCKHLQCFDLENFLFLNRDRTQWNCAICAHSIPFPALELDQHQMNIIQTLSEPSMMQVEDVLVESSGQWQTYHAPPPPVPMQQQQQQIPMQAAVMQNTAKSTGTYHPQAPPPPPNQLVGHIPGQQQQPLRPMSGPGAGSRVPLGGSPAPYWEQQQPQHSRPASAALAQQAGRRSANGSPLAKRPYAGQFQSSPNQQQLQYQPNNMELQHQQQSFAASNDPDELSPLAAMERAIIQHEQQMGPPPFDPNSLTSTSAPPAARMAASQQAGTANLIPSPPMNQLCQVQESHHQQQQQRAPQTQAFSSNQPLSVPSPAQARMSPQHQSSQAAPQRAPDSQQQHLPQSPQLHAQQHQTSISMPPTPSSSSVLLHGAGPETPATPSNSGSQHHQQQQHQQTPTNANHHSPHVNHQPASSQQISAGVDHQPLSNGSASAGSITSTSTLTPSGQSLGSVGMGGDSRCGTAPLTLNQSLDDLLMPGSSQQYTKSTHGISSPHIDEKNEILMGKLLMDSSESLLRDHRHGDQLSIALEEAEWKQQLEARGKSEHLANFLNEPLMKKQQHGYQQQLKVDENASKMLSGGLNPSDDEGANQSHDECSPSGAHNLDQLDHYANYMDPDAVDNGAGLPPDDSILDLFER